jgi:MFS family permease
MNHGSAERLSLTAEDIRRSWSMASAITTPEMELPRWELPPVPPIPVDEDAAWRRRSIRRSSLTSLMSVRPYERSLHGDVAADAEKQDYSRPVSGHTTASRYPPASGHGDSRSRIRPPDIDVHAQLHWDINALNPRNWSSRKRWLHTLLAAMVTFTIMMASSIAALASTEFKDHFSISTTLAELPYAIFVLGLAFGPLLAKPLHSVLGVKAIYIGFFPLFAILTLATGVVDTGYGLVVCRAIAGFFGSAAFSVGSIMLNDIWNREERSVPLIFYHTALLLGPVIGVVLSGYVTERRGGRWTQYVVLFASAGCVIPILLISETSKTIILRRKNGQSMRAWGGWWRNADESTGPVHSLFTKSTGLLLSLYGGFTFGVLYGSFLAFPRVFMTIYSFNLGPQGLTYLSMAIGLLVGFLILLVNDSMLYKPRVARWQQTRAAEAEKAMAANRRRAHASSRVIKFSRPNVRKDSAKYDKAVRISITQALKRAAAGLSDGALTPPPIVDPDRSVSLAVAAADHLNGLAINRERCTTPERMQLLFNSNIPFGDFCEALEGQGLSFERVQLAKVLVDALQQTLSTAEPGTAVHEPPSALLNSMNMHREAATAALSAPPVPPEASPTSPAAGTVSQRWMTDPKAHKPPARWRLLPALPASIILAGSLFFFGWTARTNIPWIAPCVAMGVFAFAALLLHISIQLYWTDLSAAEDSGSAMQGTEVVRYLMGFGFAMFAVPMYNNFGVAWASSVFSFVALGLGLIPWMLMLVWKEDRNR